MYDSSDVILLLPWLNVVSLRNQEMIRTGHISVICYYIAWLYVDTKQSLNPITGH